MFQKEKFMDLWDLMELENHHYENNMRPLPADKGQVSVAGIDVIKDVRKAKN